MPSTATTNAWKYGNGPITGNVHGNESSYDDDVSIDTWLVVYGQGQPLNDDII